MQYYFFTMLQYQSTFTAFYLLLSLSLKFFNSNKSEDEGTPPSKSWILEEFP